MGLVAVTACKYHIYGKNSFKFLAPKLWNMLNDDLRTTPNITYFRNNCLDSEKKLDWLLLIFTSLLLLLFFRFNSFVTFLLECTYMFIVIFSRRY